MRRQEYNPSANGELTDQEVATDLHSIIAATLGWTDLHDAALATRYAQFARRHGPHRKAYRASVDSLVLLILTQTGGSKSQIDRLLMRVLRAVAGTRFMDYQLLEALTTLSEQGRAPWWTRLIVESMWSEEAAKVQFWPPGEPELLARLEELHAQLPPMPEGHQAIEDLGIRTRARHR